MSYLHIQEQLTVAQSTIEVLQFELAETNRGLMALMSELEAKTDALSTANDRLMTVFSQLSASFHGIVQALAAMSEWRDPYTAGHQRRVAQLSSAICAELGGSPEDCEHIHMAGLLHDIGKIAVPTEILCKPGKLLPPEFELIKLHPQAGYEILSRIQFSHPIAEIVRQHHFRLNGTGYPGTISPSELLYEAKILAVADVMEAMSSHRPYRPSLGDEASLYELHQGVGTSFDTDVVTACHKIVCAKQVNWRQ